MKNADSREFSDLCQRMGALLARQEQPWRLVYAMMDDIYVGYWQHLRATDQLDRQESKLTFLAAWKMYIHQQTRYAVDNERFNKKSWQQIGDTLGMTKQAAQQKFGRKASGA